MALRTTPLLAVIALALAGAGAWWWQKPGAPVSQARAQSASSQPGKGQGAQSVGVEVASVGRMALSDQAQSVGSLRSRRSVVLRPEVSGRIVHLGFGDGARVRKGQLLVQLDDQLPRAQVQQARAELSIAQANHRRNQELVAQGFVSQRSLDESAANLQVAQAKLALADATLARLRIVAPFDGVAGIRNVHVGDYLKDGTDIVNVEDIEQLVVDYRLPERNRAQLRVGQSVLVEPDALAEHSFTAKVLAIDPQIDANGRSVGVRAGIDRSQGLLRPGMFARVTTIFGEPEMALVVPEEAVLPQGGGAWVYRLETGADGQGLVARRVSVQLGLRRAGVVQVRQGLGLGDKVVTAGQQRLQRDGLPVRVVLQQDTAAPAEPTSGPRPAALAASAASAPAR